MNQPLAPSPSDPVQVVIEDDPALEDRVREAARRAKDSGRAVELVESVVPDSDHDARALMIRRMDEALVVARHAAPGIEIRVGAPNTLLRPRGMP